MEDKLKQFYDIIAGNPTIQGLPDYETFQREMARKDVSDQLYNIIKDNPTIVGLPNNPDDFYEALGLKKKDITLEGLASGQSASQMLGIPSKEPLVQPQPLPLTKPVKYEETLPADTSPLSYIQASQNKGKYAQQKVKELQDKALAELNDEATKLYDTYKSKAEQEGADTESLNKELEQKRQELIERKKKEIDKGLTDIISGDGYDFIEKGDIKQLEKSIQDAMAQNITFEKRQQAIDSIKQQFLSKLQGLPQEYTEPISKELDDLIAKNTAFDKEGNVTLHGWKVETQKKLKELEDAKYKLMGDFKLKYTDFTEVYQPPMIVGQTGGLRGFSEEATKAGKIEQFNRDYEEYRKNLLLVNQAREKLGNVMQVGDNKQTFADAFRLGGRELIASLTTAGYANIGLDLESGKLAQKVQKGEPLSVGEKAVFEAKNIFDSASSEMGGAGFKLGNVVAQGIPFIEQMALMGGMGVGRGVASETVKKLLTKEGVKLFSSQGAKIVGRELGKAGLTALEAAPLMPISYQRMIRGMSGESVINTQGEWAIDPKTVEEGLEAVVKGLYTGATEYLTESIGGMIGEAGGVIKKIAKWADVPLPKFYSAVTKLGKQVKLQGTPTEILEELINIPLQAPTGDQPLKDVTGKDIWDTIWTTAGFTSILAGMGLPSSIPSQMRRANEMNIIKILGRDKVAQVRDAILARDYKAFNDAIKDIEGVRIKDVVRYANSLASEGSVRETQGQPEPAKPSGLQIGERAFTSKQELFDYMDTVGDKALPSVNEIGYLSMDTYKALDEWRELRKTQTDVAGYNNIQFKGVQKDEGGIPVLDQYNVTTGGQEATFSVPVQREGETVQEYNSRVEGKKLETINQFGGQTDAERTGKQTEEGSQQAQGLEQGEESGLRVRDASQDRVETVKGEEVAPQEVVSTKEEVSGGEQNIETVISEVEDINNKNKNRSIGLIAKSRDIGNSILNKAKQAGGWFSDNINIAINRYVFVPIEYRDDYGEKRVYYKFLPRPTNNTITTKRPNSSFSEQPELANQYPEVVMYDKTMVDVDGNIIDSRYKRRGFGEENELSDDTFDPEHLYRGISLGELSNIAQTGGIKSSAKMNLGGQEETTSFAQFPSQAASYADGFTAWWDDVTFEQPRYVIKVKKEGVQYKPTIKGQEKNEVNVIGVIPKSNIVDIWEIKRATATPGTIDISERRNGQIEEGGRSPMGGLTVFRKLTPDEVSNVLSGKNSSPEQLQPQEPAKGTELPLKEDNLVEGTTGVQEEQKIEETGVVQPPAPPQEGKVTTKEGEGETRKREIGRKVVEDSTLPQEVKDDLLQAGIEYVPRGRKFTNAESRALVDIFGETEGGLEALAKQVYDIKNDINPDTRVALNVYIAQKYSRQLDDTQDPQERLKIRKKLADAFIFGQEFATTAGQTVEAMKQWGTILSADPEAIIIIKKRQQTKNNERALKESEGDIKTVKEMLDAVLGTDEFKQILESEVNKAVDNIANKKYGVADKKKIEDFFDNLLIKDDKLFDATIGIPIAVYNGAIQVIKRAVLAGVDVANAVKQAVDYIDEWYKKNYADGKITSPEWSKDDYVATMTERVKPLTKKVKKVKYKLPKKQEDQLIDKIYAKMEGADKNQLRRMVREYIAVLEEEGAVTQERFRDLFARAIGLEVLTPEDEQNIRLTGQAINHARKVGDRLVEKFNEIVKETDETKIKQLESDIKQLKKEAQKAREQAQIAAKKLADMLSEETTLGQVISTLIQGNLLTPISLITNVIGNTAFLPVRGIRTMVASALDFAIARTAETYTPLLKSKWIKSHPRVKKLLRGLPTPSRVYNSMAAARGFAMGAKSGTIEGLQQLISGTLPEDVYAREIAKGLDPIKAYARLRDQLTGKEQAKFDRIIADFLESLPGGYTAEAFFRLLNLGDKPFRRAAERARLEELASLKGLKGRQREAFLNNPDEDSMEEARRAGEVAVYQQDSFISQKVAALQKELNKKDSADSTKRMSIIIKTFVSLLKATQAPYVKTPVNLITETFEYAIPVYSLGRAFEQVARGNKRKAYDYFAKAAVGWMLVNMATFLLREGLLSPPPDEEEKVRQAQYTAKPGYSLNIDALMRKISGDDASWKDGDKVINIQRFGVFSMILMAVSKAYEQVPRDEFKQLNFLERDLKMMPSVVGSALDQSFLSGTASGVTAFIEGGPALDRWAINTAKALSAVFYPNTLAQISQIFFDDNYIREVRNMYDKDERFKKQITNTFKDRMFMGKDLPAKVTIWGERVNRVPEGRNWPYALFDVTKSVEYQKSSFGTRMFEFYEKYNYLDEKEAKRILPMLPSASNTVGWDDRNMTPQEVEELQINVGRMRKAYVENLMNSAEWQDMADEDKIAELEKIYRTVASKVKASMFLLDVVKKERPLFDFLERNDLLPIPGKAVSLNVGRDKVRLDAEQTADYYDDVQRYFADMMLQSDINWDMEIPQEQRERFKERIDKIWNKAKSVATKERKSGLGQE